MFNPEKETMPREKLRDLQLDRLKKLVEWSYERNPVFREKMDRASMKPGDMAFTVMP